MNETLTEYTSSAGATLQIDRTAGVLRGVKLLGLTSKNNRQYPDTTLAAAAKLYDGAKVNVNHDPRGPLAPRNYQDRLGTIRKVRHEPGRGLYADLVYNPRHSLAEQLLWDAEHAPENVGFSHNVQGRTSKRDNTTVVEEIIAVTSVDLVADPATTAGLYEHQQPPATHKDELAALREEIEQLRRQANAATVNNTIDNLLAAHGLPPRGSRDPHAAAVTSATFIEQLTAADQATAARLIEDRAAAVRAAKSWRDARPLTPPAQPQSRDQHHGAGAPVPFADAIRG